MVEVKAIEAAATQPVHNLDAAEDHDFLLGTKRLFVHDSGFVQPVAIPFDREPDWRRFPL